MMYQMSSEVPILPTVYSDQTAVLDELIWKTMANIEDQREILDNFGGLDCSFENFVEQQLLNPFLPSESIENESSLEMDFLPDTPPMFQEVPSSSSFSHVNPSLAILRALSGTDPTNGQMTAAAARVVLQSKEMSRHMSDESHNELLVMASSHPENVLNKPLRKPSNKPIDKPFKAPLNTSLNKPANKPLNTPLNTVLNTHSNTPTHIYFNSPNKPSSEPLNTPSEKVLETTLNMDSSLLSESDRRELKALRELNELRELKQSKEWKEFQDLKRLKESKELKEWKELQELQELSNFWVAQDLSMPMEEDFTETCFFQSVEEFSGMDYKYFPTGLLEDVVYMGQKK